MRCGCAKNPLAVPQMMLAIFWMQGGTNHTFFGQRADRTLLGELAIELPGTLQLSRAGLPGYTRIVAGSRER